MKPTFASLAAVAAIAAAPLVAPAQTYVYEGLIDLDTTGPLALAGDAAGNLYAVTFVTGATGGSLIYIEDPISEIDTSGDFPDDPSGVEVFDVDGWPSGRGLMGVAVDSTGNVYVSGDDGAGTFIVKLSPAPDFDEITDFDASGIGTRIGGVTLMNDDIIVAVAFGSLLFIDTEDGSLLETASGAPNFQRSVAYNPADEVFYPFSNGADSAVMVRGYFSGGSATDLGGFGFTADEMISDGAVDSQFGGATQHGFFDTVSGRLISADTQDNDTGVRQTRIWDVSGDGTTLTLAQAVDADTPDADGAGQPFPLESPRDAVVIGDRLYVSTTNNDGSLYVFIDEDAVTSVSDWTLFN